MTRATPAQTWGKRVHKNPGPPQAEKPEPLAPPTHAAASTRPPPSALSSTIARHHATAGHEKAGPATQKRAGRRPPDAQVRQKPKMKTVLEDPEIKVQTK